MAKQTTDYQSILSDLKQKKYKSVYFLMGEEPYYIDIISDYILNNVLDEPEREFNQMVLYGNDVDIKTVINAAKRFPMMSPYQVVVVKEAQNIKNLDELSFYLQKPQLSTLLVFCYKYGKPDGRKKFMTEIDKTGVLFESKKLYDNQVPAFITNHLKEKNVGIDPKATQILADYLGTNLGNIVNELDKLVIGKPAGTNTITPELVEKNVGISKDFNNFELLNALINKDVFKANQIVFYFEQNPKNNPLVLTMTVLYNFFSNLMVYYYLKDKSQGAVARDLGINPYFVKDYQTAAKNFNGWKTMEIISLLRTYDAKSKGVENSAPDGELLKELVYKILH
ncbi:MAG: DNA polymerase III subunit delta [Prevotellaceae bacterium]|jgi:DNA polymerase-3 subunit delta|nr:DNA polymerase III subunit delta [Prevotellaceae bacterium]